MPRLFALDHNFPDPIASALAEFQADAELVRVDRIDDRIPDLEDWELLLALHHHAQPWDGLITTDSSILNQGPELATLIQTRLTLVVALAAGHNPVKASGLLFAYLGGICQRTEPSKPQVWTLNAANRPHRNRGTSSSGSRSTTTATRTRCGRSSSSRQRRSPATRSRRSDCRPVGPPPVAPSGRARRNRSWSVERDTPLIGPPDPVSVGGATPTGSR